jgi:hypothetical protein
VELASRAKLYGRPRLNFRRKVHDYFSIGGRTPFLRDDA